MNNYDAHWQGYFGVGLGFTIADDGSILIILPFIMLGLFPKD